MADLIERLAYDCPRSWPDGDRGNWSRCTADMPCVACAAKAEIARLTRERDENARELAEATGVLSRTISERDDALAQASAWRDKFATLEVTRASCCMEMERERDEARADAKQAWDEAVQARVEGARLIMEATMDVQTDCEQLRALLLDCERGIRTNWDASPPEWVPPSKAEVLSRLKAALETHDGGQ